MGHRDHRGLGHRRVLHHGVLDLDGGDVLAAADDDVLLAVAQLDVAVGVHHPEVTGVEPASLEGLGSRLFVVEVALHAIVAAHHHLTHGGGVVGDVVHLSVDHPQVEGVVVGHSLARHHLRAGFRVQGFPILLQLTVDVGSVGLREAIEVNHPDPQTIEICQQRR